MLNYKRIHFCYTGLSWCLLIYASVIVTSCEFGDTDSQGKSYGYVDTKFLVARIVDGDTFYLKNSTDNADLEKIRLIGVDAPETRNVWGKRKHPFGDSSKRFLENLIEGKFVYLEYDISQKDRYGRTLAYVFRKDDSLFVNAELIKQGYAVIMTVPPNVKYSEYFLNLQRDARLNRRGIWLSYGSFDTTE